MVCAIIFLELSRKVDISSLRMKMIAVLALLCLLNSCNTAIGMYRDTKQGIIWTADKIKGSDNGGGGSDPYGAPTY